MYELYFIKPNGKKLFIGFYDSRMRATNVLQTRPRTNGVYEIWYNNECIASYTDTL